MKQRASSPRWPTIIVSILLLTLFLSACGSGVPNKSKQTNNLSPAQPAVTPTAQPVETLDMKPYKGKLFSINYPSDWQKVEVGDSVTFTSSQTGYLSIEAIPNPDNLTSVSTGIAGSINGLKSTFPDNFTKIKTPNTTTINGVQWNQNSVSGSATAKGTTHTIRATILGVDHPERTANTKLFLVIYTADATNFDQLVASAFNPMLSSLKLTN
jgi:hypothetical protein